MLIVLVCIVNGMGSPLTVLLATLGPVWLPGTVAAQPPIVLYLAQLVSATMTLMISGVPAALYERAVGAKAPTTAAMAIWLAAAVVLSLPALPLVSALFLS